MADKTSVFAVNFIVAVRLFRYTCRVYFAVAEARKNIEKVEETGGASNNFYIIYHFKLQ